MADETPWQPVVDRFTEDGAVSKDAMAVATLTVLWVVEPDGQDAYVSKFDGRQRISTTLGDLVELMHRYLHEERHWEDDDGGT